MAWKIGTIAVTIWATLKILANIYILSHKIHLDLNQSGNVASKSKVLLSFQTEDELLGSLRDFHLQLPLHGYDKKCFQVQGVGSAIAALLLPLLPWCVELCV